METRSLTMTVAGEHGPVGQDALCLQQVTRTGVPDSCWSAHWPVGDLRPGDMGPLDLTGQSYQARATVTSGAAPPHLAQVKARVVQQHTSVEV